eukprot:191053_1
MYGPRTYYILSGFFALLIPANLIKLGRKKGRDKSTLAPKAPVTTEPPLFSAFTFSGTLMSPVSREYSSLAKAGAEAATVANAAALVEAVAFARNALLSEEGGARASDVAIMVISAIVESFMVCSGCKIYL